MFLIDSWWISCPRQWCQHVSEEAMWVCDPLCFHMCISHTGLPKKYLLLYCIQIIIFNVVLILFRFFVADRILIVPGNLMQQCWSVERISSIISPTKPHKYIFGSSYKNSYLCTFIEYFILRATVSVWNTMVFVWMMLFIKNNCRFLQ